MQTKTRIETPAQMQKFVDSLYNITQQRYAAEIKRKQWRLTYITNGEVTIQSQPESQPIYVTTKDISTDGIGLMTKHQFQPGQKLTICIKTDGGDVEFTGTVVHCTPTVGMFKVGVKFDLTAPENN